MFWLSCVCVEAARRGVDSLIVEFLCMWGWSKRDACFPGNVLDATFQWWRHCAVSQGPWGICGGMQLDLHSHLALSSYVLSSLSPIHLN